VLDGPSDAGNYRLQSLTVALHNST